MAYIYASDCVSAKEEKGPFDDVELPTDYRPSAEEPFMNERQLAYFRKKLIEWKDSLLKESKETLATLQNESLREPDVTDRASNETDWSIELRTRDRQDRKSTRLNSSH